MSIATNGPGGTPHLLAMWYAFLENRIYLETKRKSQKAANLRRASAIACLVESGDTYDELRGVCIDGQATIIDDMQSPEAQAAMRQFHGRYFDEPANADSLSEMSHNRILVRVDPLRVRSWDHCKLGLRPSPLAGTTATVLLDSYRRRLDGVDP